MRKDINNYCFIDEKINLYECEKIFKEFEDINNLFIDKFLGKIIIYYIVMIEL